MYQCKKSSRVFYFIYVCYSFIQPRKQKKKTKENDKQHNAIAKLQISRKASFFASQRQYDAADQ